MLLADDLVLDPCTLLYVHDGLVVVWDLVRANDIVLTFGKTSGTRRCRGETAGVLEIKELGHFCLDRLLEEDLPKVNNFIWMLGKNNVPGRLGLRYGEDLEGVYWTHCLG